MQVRLEVTRNRANVKRVVLRNDVVIGRSPDCNLRIASSEVSRQHCKILLTDGGVLVRDLNSSNGTFVDGTQIAPETDVAVAPGSRLAVGGIEFVIHYEYEAPGETSAAEPGSTVDLPPTPDTAALPVPSEAVQDIFLPPGKPEPAGVSDDSLHETVVVEPHEPPRSVDAAPAKAAPDENPFAFIPAADDATDPPGPLDVAAQESAPASETVADDEPAEIGAAEAVPAEETAPEKVSKRRSLFGLLGRKKDDTPLAQEEAVPEAPPTTEAPAEDVVPEPVGEPAESDAAPAEPEVAGVSEDEAADFLAAADEEHSPAGEEDDLGDFLKHLGP